MLLKSLRGSLYEEKIINLIKSKMKPNKEIDTKQAEKIIKDLTNQIWTN